MTRTGVIKILGFIAAGAAVCGFFAFAGYKIGASRLASGVSAVDMAKVGMRMSLSTAYRGARVNPIWAPDGDRFVFNAAEDGGVKFRLADPTTGSVTDFLDEAPLKRALSGLLEQPVSGKEFPFTEFVFTSQNTIEFVYDDRRIEYDIAAERARFVAPITADEADPLALNVVRESFPQVWSDQKERLAPDRRGVLSLDDDSLVYRRASGEETAIAPKGPAFTDWVLNDSHWSPDSRYVAAVQVDTSGVAKAPVVDWMNISEPVEYHPYPTVPGDIMTFRGLIYDTESGTARAIAFERETYVKPLSWLPDGSAFLYAVLSRDARRIEILAASPDTGEVRTILSETSESYFIYPPSFLFRGGPDYMLFPDGEKFVWISERTGFRQLYLYGMDGRLIRQLTDHPFEVATVDGVNPQTGDILYTARSDPDRPYDIHVHAVNAAGGQSARLSEEPGQHEIAVSPSGRFYVDKYSTTAHPPIVELRSSDGELARVLSFGERRLGADYMAPPPEHFSALAADGETIIHGVIFKPSGFDPNRKYPVINGIYAGGFINNVPHKYDSRHPFSGAT